MTNGSIADRRPALEFAGFATAPCKDSHPILPALADTVEFRIPLEYLRCYRRRGNGSGARRIRDVRTTGTVLPARRVRRGTGVYAYLGLSDRSGRGARPTVWRGISNDQHPARPERRRCRGRVYLPQHDLQRFAYSERELKHQEANESFLNLMHFEIARTERFYDSTAELEPFLEPDGRRVFRDVGRVSFRGTRRQFDR